MFWHPVAWMVFRVEIFRLGIAPRYSMSMESTLRKGTLFMRFGITPRRWVAVQMVRITGRRMARPEDRTWWWGPTVSGEGAAPPAAAACDAGVDWAAGAAGAPGTGCSCHTSRLSCPITVTKRQRLSVSIVRPTAQRTSVRV